MPQEENDVAKIKSPRNKTLDLNLDEGRRYLERCLTLTARPPAEQVVNRTINGDSLKVMELLPPAFADLAIIDPPYNLTKDYHGNKFAETGDSEYEAYTESWIAKLKPLLKPTASVYVCCDWKSSLIIGPVLKNIFKSATASPGSAKKAAAPCITGKTAWKTFGLPL